VVLSMGNSLGALALTFTQSPRNPDLNIEEINTAFTFVRADGSQAPATYQGRQVTEQLYGNTHTARSVSFSVPALAIEGSDLYHLATWQGFTKLRIGIAVMYYQPAPGIPPTAYTKTVDLALDQDLPALEGTGYFASFVVDTTGMHPVEGTKDPSHWQYTAVVTYPDGSVVTSSPVEASGSMAGTPFPFALFLQVPGFRPSTGPSEKWKVTLDVTGDGVPDLEWDIPEGFDTRFSDFNCLLDEQTGQPINP